MRSNLMKTEDIVPEEVRQQQADSHYCANRINRQQALANLGGNTALYNKYLSNFKTNYINSPNEISCMLKTGRIKDARILIHSVKGLAGTLGLAKLFYTAAELESALNMLLYSNMESSMPAVGTDSVQVNVIACRSGDICSASAVNQTPELYTSLLKRFNKYLQEI